MRATTKICIGCRLIVHEDKYGALPAEVLCRCPVETRRTTYQFSDSFDSFDHAADCPCAHCDGKQERRAVLAERGRCDATEGRPATNTSVWYLDAYVAGRTR